MEEDKNFKLLPLVEKSGGDLIDPSIGKQEDIEDEIDEAISNMKDQNEKLVDALTELITVAKASQNDKYYNALANLAKAVNESNRDVVNTLKTKSEHIKNNTNNAQAPVTYSQVNHNTLVMTTTEMIEQLRQRDTNG